MNFARNSKYGDPTYVVYIYMNQTYIFPDYYMVYIYIYIYIYISSSSSSYRAGSTDILDHLSPLLPIVHRPR